MIILGIVIITLVYTTVGMLFFQMLDLEREASTKELIFNTVISVFWLFTLLFMFLNLIFVGIIERFKNWKLERKYR